MPEFIYLKDSDGKRNLEVIDKARQKAFNCLKTCNFMDGCFICIYIFPVMKTMNHIKGIDVMLVNRKLHGRSSEQPMQIDEII